MTQTQQILQTMTDLTQQKGWGNWQMLDLITALPDIDIPKILQSKQDSALLLRQEADQAMVKASEQFTDQDSLKDRLLESFLVRFETLQPYRPLLNALLNDGKKQPISFLCDQIIASKSSMEWLYDGVVSYKQQANSLDLTALMACYGWAVKAWLDDQDTMLQATMAELDRSLTMMLKYHSQFAA